MREFTAAPLLKFTFAEQYSQPLCEVVCGRRDSASGSLSVGVAIKLSDILAINHGMQEGAIGVREKVIVAGTRRFHADRVEYELGDEILPLLVPGGRDSFGTNGEAKI